SARCWRLFRHAERRWRSSVALRAGDDALTPRNPQHPYRTEMNMGRLNGKVAIVTGAGRGIGRATAKLFAAEGAKVAVLSLTPANVDAVVADIEAAGGTALGVPCDVANPDQIKAAVDRVVAAYGAIDILVNLAFDPSAVLSSVIDLSVDQLQRNF